MYKRQDLNNEIKKQLLAQGYRKLPIEISTIAITRNDNITNSTHMESTFGVIPDFTDENLDKILAKKNNSLKKYKLCDEQWLLIIEGWDFYSYYQEINITKKITTCFDRVFMYRRFSSEVSMLK